MRMRAVTGASAGAAVETRIQWIHHHHHHGRNWDQEHQSISTTTATPTTPSTTTPPPPESLPFRRMLRSPGIYYSRRMQLSREGSGCGGRSHHRHRHHLRRILPPTTPPTPPPTASAEIATNTVNQVDIAIAVGSAELLLWGSGSVTEGGARRRYRTGDGRRQGASAGPLPSDGGVTGGADRWRYDRCRGRRGKRRSHGRGREQAAPEG